MADEKTNTTTSKTTAAEPTAATQASTDAEKTTANDGAIAINKPDGNQAVKPSPGDSQAVGSSAEGINRPTAIPVEATTAETANVPSAPVVISEADVAKQETQPASSGGDVSEQIEILTGEIQALEAKIERLTGGVSNNSNTEAPIAPIAEEPVPAKTELAPEAPKADESKSKDTPAASTDSAKPVNDIYTKAMAESDQGKVAPADHKDLNDDATLEEGGSGIGTIGEVLVVFGMITLFVLLVSPLLKDVVGPSIWDAVRSIGWPIAAASMALGFILSLFMKGKIMFKIFAFLLTVLLVVMTLGVFGSTSLLGPSLETLFTFYR